MARVLLQFNWYGPDLHLYQHDPKGTEIPAQFCAKDKNGKNLFLPSTAKVLDAEDAPKETAEYKNLAHENDLERESAKREAEIFAKAQAHDNLEREITKREARAQEQKSAAEPTKDDEAQRQEQLRAALERASSSKSGNSSSKPGNSAK